MDYVIGDVQGCATSLQALLRHIDFKRGQDTLYFAGDLINRGPDNVETLHTIRSLGTGARAVLGNHDLYLLAIAAGVVPSKAIDTFHDLLAVPGADDWQDWLARLPLALPLPALSDDAILVHAGLLPQWTTAQALALSREVENVLATEPSRRRFLRAMFGNQPDSWSDSLRGDARLRVIVNAMTRLRVCTAHGHMEFTTKANPADAPAGYVPWFDVPGRKSAGSPIVFGHWSALGHFMRDDLIALDSGCVWGRQLTAVRLQDRAVFQVDCPQYSSLAE